MNRGSVVVIGPVAPLRGGIAAHTERLLEAMQRQDVETTAVSYSRLYPRFGFPGTSQFHAAATARAGGDAPPPHAHALIDTLGPRTWKRAAAFVEQCKPARVVAQWWHPFTGPALVRILGALPAGSVTVVCHNVLPHERFPLARRMAAATLACAGLVVCHSRSVALQVRSLLPRARIETVPLPALIDVRSFGFGNAASALADGRRAWAASRYGIPHEAPLVLMAGHVRPYKGADVLVEAWKRRRGNGPAARATLVLAGECYLRGPARRRLLSAVRSDPSIVFVDRYVDDVELVRLLSICQALVLPYRHASQSGMLALATELGVPCVVSDAGSLGEQARGATVVPAGDVAALGDAVDEVLARPPGAAVPGGRADASCAAAAAGPATFREQWSRVVEVVSEGFRP